MNNENENKAYPCDEPEAKKSYPCDTEGEAFSYAENNGDAGEDVPVRKGKGRRGGNAAASVVVHSGKRPAYEKRSEERGVDRERRGGRNFDKDRDFGGRKDRTEDPDRSYRGRRDDAGRSFGYGRDGERSERRGRSFDRGESFGDRSFDRDRHGRSDDRREPKRFGDRDFEGRDYRRGRFGDRQQERRGRNAGGRDSRGSRPQSPEAVFSKAYVTKVVKTSDVGAFVEAPAELVNGGFGRKIAESGTVLLPFAEQIGRPVRGDEVKVYFYEDKGGRMTATMRTPILRDGEVGILTVAAVTSIGAFLDNGVPKQVLLPFKEQIAAPKPGDEVLVWIYSDKSGRQAATMRVYGHLDKNSPYKEDDRVTGFVYEINPKLGVFVAVDNKYYGLVPIRETFKEYEYGDEVEARVVKVREDGKLDLLIRDKLYKTVNEDADVILYELRRNNGFLPYGDRADAAFIEETYAMSKNQFKRALGHLYKNRVVEIDREHDTVRLLK